MENKINYKEKAIIELTKIVNFLTNNTTLGGLKHRSTYGNVEILSSEQIFNYNDGKRLLSVSNRNNFQIYIKLNSEIEEDTYLRIYLDWDDKLLIYNEFDVKGCNYRTQWKSARGAINLIKLHYPSQIIQKGGEK